MRAQVALLLICGAAAGQADGKVRLVRDLARLPAGTYEIVQSYDLRSTETVEQGGREETGPESRNSNTFTFDLKVEGKPPLAVVTVRRIEIKVEGEPSAAYDSAGAAADQSVILREQFRHLVGRTSKVDLAAFAKGEGFQGLDAAWADYLKANPGKERWAEANRKNYGDARLDRMFARGLDILFGKEAGRADGRTLDLAAGQSFEVELEEPGIGYEPKALKHACKVRAVGKGDVTLDVAWKENGLRPTADGLSVIVRGADIECTATMTFLVEGGLLVGLAEELKRTDQVSNGAVQKTRRSTERTELTIKTK